LRIEVVVDADGVTSAALTVTVHETDGPFTGVVVRIRASYVPAIDGAFKVTLNFAVTYVGVLTVELISADTLLFAITTAAVEVSINEIVADFAAPDGCVNIAEIIVAVSAEVCEINDNVTTAVADSPAVTVVVPESMTRVGAFTAALVGSAVNVPRAKAAAIANEIFLNEFIFLLVSSASFETEFYSNVFILT